MLNTNKPNADPVVNTRLDVRKRFGLVIRQWRKQSGITQDELAWRADLHRTYISDVERGARNLSLQSIEKLAGALKISISTLFHPLEDCPDIDGNALSVRNEDD